MKPMMSFSTAFLGCLLSSGQATAAKTAASKVVVVLEFRGNAGGNLSREQLIIITDQARKGTLEAVAGRPFKVRETEDQQIIVQQMGCKSGAPGECDLDIAQKLKANYFVTGEVLGNPGKYYLTMKLRDGDSGG